MTKDNKQRKEQPVDPYTGEETLPAKDADNIEEIVPVDSGDRSGENYLLKEETSMDHTAADNNADAISERSARYTEDEEIRSGFKDRQRLAAGGRKKLEEELEKYHSKSPKLSGGDLDAEWQSADLAGEETVGGSTPTPGQNVVDELGQAAGLTYEDNEPLGGEEKLLERDRNRLEPYAKATDKQEERNIKDGI